MALSRVLAHRLVQPDRLDDLVTDRVHRAERGHRLLEDEPDLAAVDRAHLGAIGLELREIDRVVAFSPSRHLAVLPTDFARRSRISPPTMRPGRSTMRMIERAVTLLPQPLSPTIPSVRRENVEAGAIDRLDQPVILEEVGLQVAHGKKG